MLALSGHVGRIYELEHEILERRHAESDLRDERDRSQRYLNTADVILLALDSRGCITLANRYASSVLGWTVDELVGRDWIDTCIPPRLRDSIRETVPRVIAGDLSLFESAVLTKSGDERRIEVPQSQHSERIRLSGIDRFHRSLTVTEIVPQ